MDEVIVISFSPKNPKIFNLLERLEQKPVIKIDSQLAKQFGRYDKIRYLRKKNKIYFGKDHGKDKTIVYIEGITMSRKGKKFFFDGL